MVAGTSMRSDFAVLPQCGILPAISPAIQPASHPSQSGRRRNQLADRHRIGGLRTGCEIQWAEKGLRKEDFVQPWLRRMVKKGAYGVYFIQIGFRKNDNAFLAVDDVAALQAGAPLPYPVLAPA
jgi:hypothetical protein